jgi:hypothetical protein
VGGVEALIPAGGVAGILAVVIGYLLRANATDRKDYRDAVAVADRKRDAAERAHTRTQQNLDAERELRRKAEDTAARAVAATERSTEELVRLRDETKRLEAEVARLRASAERLGFP